MAFAHLLFPWRSGKRTLSKIKPLYRVVGMQSDLLILLFNCTWWMYGICGVGVSTYVECAFVHAYVSCIV